MDQSVIKVKAKPTEKITIAKGTLVFDYDYYLGCFYTIVNKKQYRAFSKSGTTNLLSSKELALDWIKENG